MLSGIGTARRRIGPALGAAELPALPRTFWYAAGGGLLAAAALLGAILVEDGAKVAIAVPACIASTLLALRVPAVAMLLLLALTGIVGTILAFTELSPGYLISVSLFGLVAATLWRLSIERGQGIALMPLAVIVVVAYLLASFGQALFSPSISAAQIAFRGTAWQVVAVPAIALAGWSVATIGRIVHGYLVLICLIAGYAIVRLAVGPAGAEREVALALAPANVLPSGEVGLYGSMLSRHQLATWCGIALPFATAVALISSGGRRRISLAAAALSAIALIGTQTRGGFVGALVGLAVVLILYGTARAIPGRRLRGALLPAATVLAAVAIGFAGVAATTDSGRTTSGENDFAQRYTVLSAPAEDAGFAARLAIWDDVIDDVARRPLGHGFGTAVFTIDNSYLRVGYEQGPLVMLFFAAMVVMLALALARSAVRSRDRPAAAIMMACCGAFVAFAVNMLVTDAVEAALVGWALAGLGIAELTSRAGSR